MLRGVARGGSGGLDKPRSFFLLVLPGNHLASKFILKNGSQKQVVLIFHSLCSFGSFLDHFSPKSESYLQADRC